jgi:hypothetical protein
MKEYLVWLPFVATLFAGCGEDAPFSPLHQTEPNSVAQSSSRGIPTVKFSTTGGGRPFSITQLKAIVVDSQFKDSQDDTLETLIPPTLTSFAQTFSEDVQSTFGINAPVSEGTGPKVGTVFLTISSNKAFVDAAGRNTSEGYAVEVSSDEIVITGASALGVWWGTRTVLQQAILGNNSIPAGKAVDSPGWSTRGIMVFVSSPFSSYLTLICILWKSSILHDTTTHPPSSPSSVPTSPSGNKTPSMSTSLITSSITPLTRPPSVPLCTPLSVSTRPPLLFQA